MRATTLCLSLPRDAPRARLRALRMSPRSDARESARCAHMRDATLPQNAASKMMRAARHALPREPCASAMIRVCDMRCLLRLCRAASAARYDALSRKICAARRGARYRCAQVMRNMLILRDDERRDEAARSLMRRYAHMPLCGRALCQDLRECGASLRVRCYAPVIG